MAVLGAAFPVIFANAVAAASNGPHRSLESGPAGRFRNWMVGHPGQSDMARSVWSTSPRIGAAMRRGLRGSGVPVDPARVREARREAGLSLAQLAGDEVSRTFLHFVEHGRSRPSQAVLALIAR